MKNMRYRAWLLAYVLIVACFFAAGYGAGVINGKNSAKEEIALATKEPEAVKTAVNTNEEEPEYTLIMEDSSLTIYEIKESGRSIIARCEISESVYPKEDILTLKEGMTFADKTDAMAMFENFAS